MRIPTLRLGSRRGQRGLSLIEVLVAFFILFVVTLAILEMFSMAFLVNKNAEMRSELSFKAEQVMEQVRLQVALQTPNACCPTTIGTTFEVTDQSGTCFNSYWGAAGANIVETNPRYELRYNITAGTSGRNVLTVEALPTPGGGFRYVSLQGNTPAGKVVRYVAQL
ncbi:MAG TPA: prepilin-type N-terminal cleavage/methylation domain-containing protein [Thermoanaerobaculaceae bacterium]|nr:prepilin-type N-terminal cleavage/methylation domain-containing protein [Thermoanaerobaculaceae bacterium]HPS78939.1 prepilin-type N-terminal cleavage/methylation domain-containing protein [Thermoanaerobaculaceae bacterium]